MTQWKCFFSSPQKQRTLATENLFFCFPFNYNFSVQLWADVGWDDFIRSESKTNKLDHKKGCVSGGEGERERERQRAPDKKRIFFARTSFLGQRVFTYVTQAKSIFFLIDFFPPLIPPHQSHTHSSEREREKKSQIVPHSKWGEFHE